MVAIYTRAMHIAPVHVHIVNTMNWMCQNTNDTSAKTTANTISASVSIADQQWRKHIWNKRANDEQLFRRGRYRERKRERVGEKNECALNLAMTNLCLLEGSLFPSVFNWILLTASSFLLSLPTQSPVRNKEVPKTFKLKRKKCCKKEKKECAWWDSIAGPHD